jgi:hypothetical protein
MTLPSSTLALLTALCASAVLAGGASAQAPAPSLEVHVPTTPAWIERGDELLRIEDPLSAWRVFRDARVDDEQAIERALGLGRSHLMLGHADHATAYGEHAVAAAPGREDAMALVVRALIRSRRFDDAVTRSRSYLERSRAPTIDLLAARGSALFRVQRTGHAAEVYRQVVARDGQCAEAHLRLGSGLIDPVVVEIPAALQVAVRALAAGERGRAIELLQRLAGEQPGHPIVHRLLGESLYAERTAQSMAMREEAFAALAEHLPTPNVKGLAVAEFVPSYQRLSPARRAVIDRTAALFRSRLGKLIQVGGRHDLLAELERTTDAQARENLRGRRTFDGRVWDDVRGVGGLRAATGIEALDEAATYGFDTFAHEVAHQVHFFTFRPLERARVRSLYKQAMIERRCLDYYAASNEAEYFGQGVEAFVSLAKRPGCETTHGHTRWELKRVDPDLYAFISSVVDFDPLTDAAARGPLLAASVETALRCGRPDDAQVAAEMMAKGEGRDRALVRIREAELELRCH